MQGLKYHCTENIKLDRDEGNGSPSSSRADEARPARAFLLTRLRINPDGSAAWLLISQLRPPDKHSWNRGLFLLNGFHLSHVCLIGCFEILKRLIFLCRHSFHGSNPSWHVVDSQFPSASSTKKELLSCWSCPATPQIHRSSPSGATAAFIYVKCFDT